MFFFLSRPFWNDGSFVQALYIYIYLYGGTRAEVQLCGKQVVLTFKMSFSTRCRYNVYIWIYTVHILRSCFQLLLNNTTHPIHAFHDLISYLDTKTKIADHLLQVLSLLLKILWVVDFFRLFLSINTSGCWNPTNLATRSSLDILEQLLGEKKKLANLWTMEVGGSYGDFMWFPWNKRVFAWAVSEASLFGIRI